MPRVSDAPFVSHQRVVLRLAIALQQHVSSPRLGEVLCAPIDIVFDAERALVLQPDLWVYDQGRREMRVLACADAQVQGSVALSAEDRMRSEVLPSFTPTIASIVDGSGKRAPS